MNDTYFSRFPSILKNDLKKYNMNFPENTLWEYEPNTVFRGIVRKKNEDLTVVNEDFLSYAELGKEPKGSTVGPGDIEYYSCSCFQSKKQLERAMFLPHPNRRIIKGKIYDTKGCISINTSSSHVDWWIYENANPAEDFEVIEDE